MGLSSRRSPRAPSSHRTVRTDPYTALHVTFRHSSILNYAVKLRLESFGCDYSNQFTFVCAIFHRSLFDSIGLTWRLLFESFRFLISWSLFHCLSILIYMSIPSPSALRLLPENFTLKYVTIFSSVPSFTTTMNGSETPWSITLVSLQRLEDLCRSYRSSVYQRVLAG